MVLGNVASLRIMVSVGSIFSEQNYNLCFERSVLQKACPSIQLCFQFFKVIDHLLTPRVLDRRIDA